MRLRFSRIQGRVVLRYYEPVGSGNAPRWMVSAMNGHHTMLTLIAKRGDFIHARIQWHQPEVSYSSEVVARTEDICCLRRMLVRAVHVGRDEIPPKTWVALLRRIRVLDEWLRVDVITRLGEVAHEVG